MAWPDLTLFNTPGLSAGLWACPPTAIVGAACSDDTPTAGAEAGRLSKRYIVTSILATVGGSGSSAPAIELETATERKTETVMQAEGCLGCMGEGLLLEQEASALEGQGFRVRVYH